MTDSTPTNITRAIDDHFKDEPEVHEVVKYVTSAMTLDLMVSMGVMSNQTEVPIPPEALFMVKRFDNGFTKNEFYLSNYAPIKMTLQLIDIKFQTMMQYMAFLGKGERPDHDLVIHCKGILLAQFDTLTVVASLWRGIEFATEFDRKFRQLVQLDAAQLNMFDQLST